jgi:GR25 family glycosyltransferase involved in LPS biosynthesis
MEKQYLDGIDVVYWINLDRAKDRKEHMEKNVINDEVFKDKKVIRLKAIDYKDKNLDKYLTVNLHNKVTNKEYACLTSHLEAIRAFSKTDCKNALIFEDDVSLDYKKYWTKTMQEIINGAPKDWGIIKLYIHPTRKLKSDYVLWKAKCIYNENGDFQTVADWGCAAYLINNKAANKFINQLYKHGKYKLPDNSFHVSDYLIYDSIKTYTYKYPYFSTRKKNKTYIQTDDCKEKNKKHFGFLRRTQKMLNDREKMLKQHKNKTMRNHKNYK